MRTKLLIVDDETIILDVLKRLLRTEFEIFTASSGAHGLELFREKQPDIILSDQRMAGMTGIEMLKQIQKEKPTTQRILLTGYTDIGAAIEAINHHLLFRYVRKPWDNEELIAILRAARTATMTAADSQ